MTHDRDTMQLYEHQPAAARADIDRTSGDGMQEEEDQPGHPASSEAPQPLRPEIWVGATSDYDGGRRYGGWLDAAQDQKDLQAEIRKIIDRTPDPLRQSWHIHDVRGFGCWNPDRRYGLPTVNRVARGIAYYGRPYSALVNLVGAESEAARTDRFEECFLGDWPTLTAFAEHFAERAGWLRRLDQLPEGMRPYVHLDLAMLARSARRDLTIIEHPSGLWIFQPNNW